MFHRDGYRDLLGRLRVRYSKRANAKSRRVRQHSRSILERRQLAYEQCETRCLLATYALPNFGTGPGDDSILNLSGEIFSRPEPDFYTFDLQAGDILGADLFGPSEAIELFDAADNRLMRSFGYFNVHSVIPDESPLFSPLTPSSLGYVIPEDGSYYIRVSSDAGENGEYDLSLRAYRPTLEEQGVGNVQYIYLDFDGATLDAAEIFPDYASEDEATPSPLSTFLDEWGLSSTDEDDLINAIAAVIEENLHADLEALGNNGSRDDTGIDGQFDVQIITSLEMPDIFGLPNVSRIIIGGTVEEYGMDPSLDRLLGLSESIDVGNFATEETTIVLLDNLSSPATGHVNSDLSLNQFSLTGGKTKIDLIAEAVGNIASHEAGHMLGNFHTLVPGFGTNVANLMDAGSVGLKGLIGTSDLVFGNGDDIDLKFGVDNYHEYIGIEDTLNTLAFGLSTGSVAGFFYDVVTGILRYTGDDSANNVTVQGTGTAGEVSVNDGSGAVTYSDVTALSFDTLGGNDDVLFDFTLGDIFPDDGISFDGGSGTDRVRVTRNGNYTLTNATLTMGLDAIDLSGIELATLTGGAGDNVIDASAFTGASTIYGLDGADVLIGGGGADLLEGGAGNDTLYARGGADTLFGHAGNDSLLGEDGNDTIYGGDNNDGVNGGAGDDTLYGENGDDVVLGDTGADALAGGSGSDTYFYLSGDQMGADSITEAADQDSDTLNFSLFGGFGGGVTIDLSSTAQQSVNSIYGLSITLQNGTGIENVVGTAFFDTITGNARGNMLDGGASTDWFIGGDGDDAIYGGEGNDLILGQAGNDSLYGGNGDDFLVGDTGSDLLTGGSGNDTYKYLSGDQAGADVIDEVADQDADALDFSAFGGFAGGVTIDLSLTTQQAVNSTYGLYITLQSGTGIENVYGSALSDTITGNSRNNMIDAGDATDWIFGGDGDDTIYGRGGADAVLGQGGSDTIYGGDGDDGLSGGDLNDLIFGEGGNDSLFGDLGNDIAYGGIGNDSFSGGDGSDTGYGGDGTDTQTGVETWNTDGPNA